MISVCMTSFNGASYIEEQIESILIQISHDDELLISDDGSIDGTLQIIEKISAKDSRVKLIYGPKAGLQKNFEYVLSCARGEYIFLSDQDDIWMNNKVATTLAALQCYDLVVSDCIVVDENANIIADSYYHMCGLRKGLWANLVKNSYLGCCMAFDRKVLDLALPFPDRVPMHDWWIGLVCSLSLTTGFLDDKLIMYRRHGSNASPTSTKSKRPLLLKFAERCVLAKELLRVFFNKV